MSAARFSPRRVPLCYSVHIPPLALGSVGRTGVRLDRNSRGHVPTPSSSQSSSSSTSAPISNRTSIRPITTTSHSITPNPLEKQFRDSRFASSHLTFAAQPSVINLGGTRPFGTMSAPQQAAAAGGGVHYTTNTNRPALPSDVKDTGHTAAATDDYLDQKLLAPEFGGDPSLEKSRERAHQAGIPEISVSPQQGQFLSVLAKGMGASKILEIGTLYGYSTTFLARALPRHGQIDTLEISELHAKVANQTFIDADLYPFPKVHLGPAIETLKKMKAPGEEEGLPENQRGYDLVFIDADKENIADYFQQSLRLTRKGGIIFVDNAIRGGRIVQQENDRPDINVVGLRKLYDWVEQDKGKTVLMSGMQTVGSKNWDGFAIATKL